VGVEYIKEIYMHWFSAGKSDDEKDDIIGSLPPTTNNVCAY